MGHFQHDLNRFSRLHELEATFEVGEWEVVGDNGFEVEAARKKKTFDLIPGFEHFAAVDAEDGGPFEDDVVGEVEGDGFGGEAEEGGGAAVAKGGEALVNGLGVAAHFEQDFGALVVCELACFGGPRVVFGVERSVGAEFLGKLEAAGADVGDENFAGAGGVGDGDGHEADRADAGDEDAAAADAGGHNGVHRVAERVEDRGDVVGDIGVDGPDVFFRHGDEFGEAAVSINAENIDLFTDVAVAGAAGLAHAAADVSFGTDALADTSAGDGGTDGVDAAHKFVAGGYADLDAAAAPGVPFVDMAIGAADAGVGDGDETITGADLGYGRVFLEPEARFVFEFADGEHGKGF